MEAEAHTDIAIAALRTGEEGTRNYRLKRHVATTGCLDSPHGSPARTPSPIENVVPVCTGMYECMYVNYNTYCTSDHPWKEGSPPFLLKI